MLYFQSNPTAWWRDWQEIPVYPDELLNLCDENGIALLLPVPTVNYAGNIYLNPDFRRDFRRETEYMIRYYRRHPSVLAWCVSMNSFNPRNGIHADTIGQRSPYNHVQAKVIQYALDQAKEIDPARLAYGHAEGNLGDLATGNTYPNFTPLQEVEDYGEIWAEKGNMPWWACEFAAVYDGSYYKGKQFLLTEYGAIYFGDKAYDRETLPQLEQTIENGLGNRGHGNIKKILPVTPLYWDIQRLYVENTDRSFRAWGMQGWHYFNFGIGYGDPRPDRKSGGLNRYANMTEPVAKRPEWANPNFDMYARNMQPLLVYIGGWPVHTDKTHAFFAGENAVKSITAVWDGPGDLTLNAGVRLVDAAGKEVFKKNEVLTLKNGDIRKFPVRFTAPQVSGRTDYRLVLTVTGWNDKTVTDEFPVQVFPRQSPMKLKHTLYVYDPKGKSPWIFPLVPNAEPWKNGIKFRSGDLLILGRESLHSGMRLPYTAEDVKNGLRVLILEQKPEMIEAFGLRTIDAAPRLVFPGSDPGMLMDHMKPEDLLYWRGKADLLPEFKHARGYEVTIAPKTSNRNVVASTVIEIPESSSFEPLFAAEFDMAYTPLLRWNNGKGYLLFNTFDFTGRVGADPAATMLASNLLSYLDTVPGNAVKIVTEKLSGTENPAETILINRGRVQPGTAEFVKKGGTVLNLALSADELKKAGLNSSAKKIYRVTPPKGVFAKIAPRNLLRWRDALTVDAISAPGAECDGIYLERGNGGGKEIFLQVAPEMLSGRYKNDPAKAEAVQLSVIRLRQLVNRVLTANGAAPSPALAGRLTKVEQGVAFQDLGTWHVFGPFIGKENEKPVSLLNKVYPGEKQALEGDTNPNITYRTDDGRLLDFRKTAASDKNGYVDLGKAFGQSGENTIGYAVKEVHSDSNRIAMLWLGFDYRAKIYVNGKLAGNYSRGPGGAPAPNKIKLEIELRKGLNIITIKMSPGSKGFGFWANLSEEGADLRKTGSESRKELIYDTEIKVRSPYEYYYW